MKLDRIFAGLNISSMGLSAQRRKMNAISENLANAETTRTEQGGPYKRKIVLMKAKSAQMFSTLVRQAGIQLAGTNADHMRGGDSGFSDTSSVPGGVEVQENNDPAPPKVVYDPGNPDADAEGYVRMPNVNVVTEMVGMIAASRAFEANITAVTAAKTMAKDSLEI